MRKTATKTNKINRKPPPAKMPPMIANGSPRYRRDNAMYTRPPAITQSENGLCRIRAHIPPVPATESPAAGPARISGTLRLRSLWSMFRGISHPGTEARSTNRLERDRTRAPPCARFGSSRAAPSRSELPNPQPGAEDVLVQVLAAGVCRTDLHLLDEVKAGEHEPLIPGHEMAGRIAKIGHDAYTAKLGDKVGVLFEQPSGR